MSIFYTNIFQRGNKIYFRGYDKGFRVQKAVKYKPYLFLESEKGTYRTLDNKPVEKIEFESIYDAKEFMEKYKDIDNFKYYGLTNFLYVFIKDFFKKDIDYDPNLIKIGTLDIECAADEGFPNIQTADKEITAITIKCNKRIYVFGCGEFKTNDPNIYYMKCVDEYDLIQKFLGCWQQLDLDIVTGWNIEFFDIPYIVNRIFKLFNEEEVKRLSPWRYVIEKTVEFRGKEQQSYNFLGISILDYYQLYRKFTFGNQESYKLDYISFVELGEKKVDYSEYGSLLELYKSNFQKFIEYNIHDCVLVDKLDEKMKFLEQVMALAYDAKVNYNDTLTTVRPWDVIIHNYLMDKKIVIPQFEKKTTLNSLVGGFVKEPKIGLSRWIVSFDLTSLYPSLIQQYNISPEKIIDKKTLREMLKKEKKRRGLT
jgi:DNA polymerase elongation subunit (family B)